MKGLKTNKIMKNIHILPTDKPSRLWKNNLLQGKLILSEESLWFNTAQQIYITSDEEIKKGDWYVNTFDKRIGKNNIINHSYHKKIILTTDQDLIKDDVRAINDTFLEWFVKNPSCEEVEVDSWSDDLDGYWLKKYKIIIPKEEPKQDEIDFITNELDIEKERMYTKEDMINFVEFVSKYYSDNSMENSTIYELLEQFKNK